MTVRMRKSIDALNKDERDMLVRAWRGIQALKPDDPKSFYQLGGLHGEPFRGAGWGNATFWGGYCNHGNVLFPTWHRVYLMKLEEALRSIDGCATVTLPYWDEISAATMKSGIPSLLTNPTYKLPEDKNAQRNPLYSYILQQNLVDHRTTKPAANYSKPEKYETVRYPLSGLVGTDADREKTKKHNKPYLDDPPLAVKKLNANIITWLNPPPPRDGNPVIRYDVRKQYLDCLRTSEYTVFSNTTSAAAWTDNHPVEVPLEKPHNSIHLACGGFDVPCNPIHSPIRGANGDMGENETASFDPLFYFHHCFVDLVFWRWQQKHKSTKKLTIMRGYPGTNSNDEQGPTPGIRPNSWLDENSPLDPFLKPNGQPYTSADVTNITALGYGYDYKGDLDLEIKDLEASPAASKTIYVTGVDRTKISGSFLISAFARVDGEERLIGVEPVLSRWHVEGCANCQTHLRASAAFPLPDQLLPGNGLLTAQTDLPITVAVTTHTPAPVETPQTLAWREDGVLSTSVGDGTALLDAGTPLYAEVRNTPDADIAS